MKKKVLALLLALMVLVGSGVAFADPNDTVPPIKLNSIPIVTQTE